MAIPMMISRRVGWTSMIPMHISLRGVILTCTVLSWIISIKPQVRRRPISQEEADKVEFED